MQRRDHGAMATQDYVTITARSKDIVILGGENIPPRETEASGSGLNPAQTVGMAATAVLCMTP
jgi:acyl-CoA synthetase (AMP-forming)/AMP-acid ligase II